MKSTTAITHSLEESITLALFDLGNHLTKNGQAMAPRPDLPFRAHGKTEGLGKVCGRDSARPCRPCQPCRPRLRPPSNAHLLHRHVAPQPNGAENRHRPESHEMAATTEGQPRHRIDCGHDQERGTQDRSDVKLSCVAIEEPVVGATPERLDAADRGKPLVGDLQG